jgi:hypothetical protein
MKHYHFKKIGIIVLFFIITFSIFLFTKAPMYFDSYVYYENYLFPAHLLLIIYRVLIYFTFPVLITVMEKIIQHNKNRFSKLLIENFNIQFCAYALLAGLYSIFGIDKILGVDIFDTADSFLFVTSFIFSILLNKKFPDLFTDEKE